MEFSKKKSLHLDLKNLISFHSDLSHFYDFHCIHPLTNPGTQLYVQAHFLFWFKQDVLEKLKALHQLPGIILEWRRITNAMTKVVFPLQREKCWHPKLEMDRIYPVSQSHTATGMKNKKGRFIDNTIYTFSFISYMFTFQQMHFFFVPLCLM